MFVQMIAVDSTLAGNNRDIDAIALSADGATVWYTDGRDNSLLTLDLSTIEANAWSTAEDKPVRTDMLKVGRVARKVALPETASATGFQGITIGATGTVVVCGGVRSWIVDEDGMVTTIWGRALLDASGTRLVVASDDGVVVKDYPSLTEKRRVATLGTYDRHYGLDLSPDGRFLAVGTSGEDMPNRVEVYDLNDGARIGAIEVEFSEWVGDVAIAPDGNRIVFSPVSTENTSAVIYDTRSGAKLQALDYNGVPWDWDVAWTADGKQIIVASGHGVNRWNVASAGPAVHSGHYRPANKFMKPDGWKSISYRSVAATADGGMVAVGMGGTRQQDALALIRGEDVIVLYSSIQRRGRPPRAP